MKNIIVLGAGMVGSAIALDLAKSYQVMVADLNISALEKVKNKNSEIKISQFDISDSKKLKIFLSDFDIIVSAVPGFMGFNTLKSIIEIGKNVVDISFFSEDPFELDKIAKQNNVTAIVDCGVAPGLDNIILGYFNQKMKITDFECYVGGLPTIRSFPFNYKAPFSPVDVIEEYTRPARIVENFEIIIKEPLSDNEYLNFEKIGTLEAFNSDGLRSLIKTMPHIKNMKEKTLRYPGHAECIRVLKESGFFEKDKLEINGTYISPLDFTSKILFKNWYLAENDDEFTVMRVVINNSAQTIIANLYDTRCKTTGNSSMARTTGYTACAAANLLINNRYISPGINPPEYVGANENCYKFIIDYLKERDVNVDITPIAYP